MGYFAFICLFSFFIGCVFVFGDEEVTDLEHERIRPSYIPEYFNDKLVQPLIPGDFEEFWELWTGRPYHDAGGNMVSDLFLMKTRYRHRSYEGVKVGTVPHYGTDLRFIPIINKDILAMTNGRELEIYTLWGKKKVETKPTSNYNYQFAYQNWLFINETTVIDLEYALNSGRPLLEKDLFWNYDVIPWETLERTVLDYVSKHCFTYGYRCIIDPDDGRVLMSNTEVVAYRNGLKLSVLDSGHNSQAPRHHFYIIEDDITNLAFYIPPDLETFTRPVNFQYHKRFMLFPNFKPSDRFVTTRRHQIFVRNNRIQFQRQLPTPESCNCQQPKNEEPPFVEIEQPLISQASQVQISIVSALICLILQLFV